MTREFGKWHGYGVIVNLACILCVSAAAGGEWRPPRAIRDGLRRRPCGVVILRNRNTSIRLFVYETHHEIQMSPTFPDESDLSR